MAETTKPVTDLIGYLVKITAPGKRARVGVVLPPRPRARNRGLRLAVSADRSIPFPTEGTITVQHDDEYSFGNLPLELLAARTALREERRREPAPDQKPIALYKLRRGYAELYAICDTVPMPALSPARAAAWAEARTCARCAHVSKRPMLELDDRKRYCSSCRHTIAFERWCDQSRIVQAEAAEWARGVLADPAAVLIASSGGAIKHIRAEPVSGTVIFDLRVRGINDLAGLAWRDDSPEKRAERREKYAGTVGPDEFATLAAPLTDARMIGWYEQDRSSGTGHNPIPHIKNGDRVSERLALFSGVAPHRNSGYYFPTPRLPWSNYPPTYVPYTSHRALRDGDSRITEIAHLRTLLHLMAHNTPPAPSWVDPTTRQVIVDRREAA